MQRHIDLNLNYADIIKVKAAAETMNRSNCLIFSQKEKKILPLSVNLLFQLNDDCLSTSEYAALHILNLETKKNEKKKNANEEKQTLKTNYLTKILWNDIVLPII